MVDLAGDQVVEGEVVQITIPTPLEMHSKMLSPLKKWPKLMPHKSEHLHISTVVMGFEVLFMGPIRVLPKIIAGFLAWTSASPPTSALVAKSPFTALFVPNGMWKGVKCGVFFARNPIQNLKI